MIERIIIDGSVEDQWGYLVKTWATGKSYFPNPGFADAIPVEKLPVPRDLDDMKAQLALIGIADRVTIPAHIVSLAVVQYSPNTLALRLPPKEMVEAGEEEFANGADYVIREFYSEFCSPAPKTSAQKLRLHACRIGDYSISSCV
jgi:hypothetical protein